ncbi:MAG: hypothetical protein L7S72_02335 [Flavobacteriales bacterium]|nr:hypothetical protein [Flavobacteriales bacterium]
MSGPWYECQGPSAAEVRKDVLSHINIVNVNMLDPYKKEKDKIINDALMKVIPDTRNDFGSWRGYSTFGVKNDLTKEVLPIIQKKYAMLVLQKKFTPYVIHQLYKPGGPRYSQIAGSTLVGRSVENPEDEE